MAHRIATLLAVLSSLPIAVGCGAADPLAQADPVVSTYADNVHDGYEETLVKALALQTAIQDFVASPTAATHEAAKDAWIAARIPYGPTEAFRFYGGPIDAEGTGPEGYINAWPLDENFIDYTRDDADAGIINHTDIFPDITAEVLRAQNEVGGEKNIATGYHAIEFLLWGQDNIDPMVPGAGTRPFTDYVTGAMGTAKNQDRRAAYLTAAAAILVEDLTLVEEGWEPEEENYRRDFVSDKRLAITRMLTGMGTLAAAEVPGERIGVAYKNKTQEDEHSCFSDTTAADLYGNGLGLANVWRGAWGSADGAGLDELVRAQDPALADQVDADMDAMLAALEALQQTPFDQAIASADSSPERERVLDAINAVKAVGDDVVPVADALGIDLQIEEPE